MYDKVKQLTRTCTQKREGSMTVTSGQSILKEEVEKALQAMKNGKTMGSDEISTEMLRALDD